MSSSEVSYQARFAAGEANRAWPLLAVATGAVGLAAATAGLFRGLEPFATWYYQFAWFPLLLALDGVVALTGAAGRRGEFLLLSRPRHLLSLLFWSAVVWYFYELWNFRLRNWYYINLPHGTAVRWIGTTTAFATVLPAIFLGAALLDRAGVGRHARWRPFALGPRGLTRIRAAGLAMVALVLLWPRYFFPLVWGATTLLVEPWVYERAPRRSLLHDLEQGRPGRLIRLLGAGAAVGFTWELLNIRARAKWIYTVPFIEEWKLFEMPVPGFLGFPPFAVECFVLWQALVVAGVAVPRFAAARPLGRTRGRLAVLAAAAFCLAVSWGMDRRTIDSLRPRLADVAAPAAAPLQAAGFDAFRLAAAAPHEVAGALGVEPVTAGEWIEFARVATTRGIGSEWAGELRSVGVTSLAALAAADPAVLVAQLKAKSGRDVVDARVRVWVRGARRAQQQ